MKTKICVILAVLMAGHLCAASIQSAEQQRLDALCSSDKYFKCQRDNQCIEKTLLCDGENDCDDASDETTQSCATVGKPLQKIHRLMSQQQEGYDTVDYSQPQSNSPKHNHDNLRPVPHMQGRSASWSRRGLKLKMDDEWTDNIKHDGPQYGYLERSGSGNPNVDTEYQGPNAAEHMDANVLAMNAYNTHERTQNHDQSGSPYRLSAYPRPSGKAVKSEYEPRANNQNVDSENQWPNAEEVPDYMARQLRDRAKFRSANSEDQWKNAGESFTEVYPIYNAGDNNRERFLINNRHRASRLHASGYGGRQPTQKHDQSVNSETADFSNREPARLIPYAAREIRDGVYGVPLVKSTSWQQNNYGNRKSNEDRQTSDNMMLH